MIKTVNTKYGMLEGCTMEDYDKRTNGRLSALEKEYLAALGK